jgi:hypothetical protein
LNKSNYFNYEEGKLAGKMVNDAVGFDKTLQNIVFMDLVVVDEFENEEIH